ncbi:hypothetical protein D3C81_2024420 [compost metagenome]
MEAGGHFPQPGGVGQGVSGHQGAAEEGGGFSGKAVQPRRGQSLLRAGGQNLPAYGTPICLFQYEASRGYGGAGVSSPVGEIQEAFG